MKLAAVTFALLLPAAIAQAPWPVPSEIRSTSFTVALNGQPTPVMHAAMNIDFLNFPLDKPVKITVTADRDDQWDTGVEVEPWRLGIRPTRAGRTLTFTLDQPGQIVLTQPNDVLFEHPTLLLFANPPEHNPPTAATPNIRYLGPGAHTEDIDLATNDNLYLAPGAVLFGSLNLWQVSHVHVFGRGIIVYDGPQNPADDDGWQHRKNWHCITMDNAHDISIEGITCVVRSRTWQIQMKDSRNILFDNIKVIGANPGNANADGMDWLGGGDTLVRNSFFRAADDVFALQSSWEGYGPKAFAVQGNPVTNISIENSVLSTSISNIVRAAWPGKNFDGGGFHLSNSDILHQGLGGCGIPFALMELWADPHGRGTSSNFTFDNLRLEHWSSLTQVMQPAIPGRTDGVSDLRFTGISALELPSLVPSVLKGAVQGVSFDDINLAGTFVLNDHDLPIRTLDGAAAPRYAPSTPTLRILTPTGLLRPHQKIKLKAILGPGARRDLRLDWTFGDGTHAHGRTVTHRFPDTSGTLLDGTGRFRILVGATDPDGGTLYAATPLLITNTLQPATAPSPEPAANTGSPAPVTGITSNSPQPPPSPRPQLAGLSYTYTEAALIAGTTGTTEEIAAAPLRHRPENYTLTFDGYLNIPADGGYTFTLVASDPATLTIDGNAVTTPAAFPQVCGLAGNAPRTVTLYAALAQGLHPIHLTAPHATGADPLRLLWQPPNLPVTDPPPNLFTHTAP